MWVGVVLWETLVKSFEEGTPAQIPIVMVRGMESCRDGDRRYLKRLWLWGTFRITSSLGSGTSWHQQVMIFSSCERQTGPSVTVICAVPDNRH